VNPITSVKRLDCRCEAADGGRGVLAGEHLGNLTGGAEEFHRAAADVGAVAVLLSAVQVAVLAEVNRSASLPQFERVPILGKDDVAATFFQFVNAFSADFGEIVVILVVASGHEHQR